MLPFHTIMPLLTVIVPITIGGVLTVAGIASFFEPKVSPGSQCFHDFIC